MKSVTKYHKLKKYLLFLIFFPANLYSQTDSLKELLNYYPLQEGNYWEYKTINEQLPYPSDSSAFSVEVKGDTTLNNKTYKILLNKSIYPNQNINYKYERIDSSNGCVYRYQDYPSIANKEYKIDSLYAQPGDIINSSRVGFLSSDYFRTVCKSINNFKLFGITTNVKTYFDQSFIPGEAYELVKGFGYYSSSFCEFTCSSTVLVFAKINGKEYGSRIITRIKETKAAPLHYQLYQNYPNPFNPNTNISFEIPKAGNVTYMIYDILGKLIEKNNLIFSTGGLHNIKFNGQNFPSGIYFYQFEYSGHALTRKMLLLK